MTAFDFVIHDPDAKFQKARMGGWARSIAPTPPLLTFDDVRERGFADIWLKGQAFQAFRGEDWMQGRCRTCDRRRIDFGGCRCQAFAVTGDVDATDPACNLAPHHTSFAALAEQKAALPSPEFVYRRM